MLHLRSQLPLQPWVLCVLADNRISWSSLLWVPSLFGAVSWSHGWKEDTALQRCCRANQLTGDELYVTSTGSSLKQGNSLSGCHY